MVWNLKQNMYPWRFTGHTGPVYSIAVSLSGNRIVSGSEDETVRVWKNTEEG
jgi:WD40 repeat protein